MIGQPGLFINNRFQEGNGGKLTSTNPTTNALVWQGRSANLINVHMAVQAARKAFLGWTQMSMDQRKAYLNTFAGILEQSKQELATDISRETGKPLWESLTEVDITIKKIAITIEAFEARCATSSEPMGEAARATLYKPHGVVAVLGPFNLPTHLPNGHICPALLAGNTVVFKPSEYTPLVGQAYMECWKKSGLPDGVINMVQGGKNTGMHIVEHVDLNGLFFTGSYGTGSAIHKAWGGQPEKILALEMGGNNPLIIDQVKDITAACYTTIQSAFITSGQRCTCARRLIVVEHPNTARYLSTLIEMAKAITIGDYLQDPQPFMGPLINKQAAKNVLRAQKALIKRGAKVLLKSEHLDKKAMVSPGIIDVTDLSVLEDEEVFGPLLQVIRVKNLDEAIAEANRTAYGLAAAILSDHRESYEQFLKSSRCGVVNWNRPTTGASSRGPFGGIGKSGNFRPSAYFAADYCSYPVATIEENRLNLPAQLTPGIKI